MHIATVQFAHMSYDDRPDPAKRLEQARRARNFKNPKEAAAYFGWVYETYIQHEQGTRGITRAAGRYASAFRVSEGWLLTGEGQGPSGDDLKVSDDGEIIALLERIAFIETGNGPKALRLLKSVFLEDDET